MKKKSTSQSAPARRSFSEGGFFNLRVLLASVLCLGGVFVALLGMGAFSNLFAQTKGTKNNQPSRQDSPSTQTPDVVRLVGPMIMDTDLRELPYVPPAPQILKQRLIPHSRPQLEETAQSEAFAFPQFQSLLEKIFRAMPNMPPPLLTFFLSRMRTSWVRATTVAAAHRLKPVQFRTSPKAAAPAPAPTTIAAQSDLPSTGGAFMSSPSRRSHPPLRRRGTESPAPG